MNDMIERQQLYVCNQWLRRLREENGELRDEIERLQARMRELEQERDNLIKRKNVVYEEACEWRDMHINANMEAKHQRERAEAAEAQVAALRKALERLLDEQNGPPLIRDAEEWQAAVDLARAALATGERDE